MSVGLMEALNTPGSVLPDANLDIVCSVKWIVLMSSSCGTSRLRIVGLADETELVSPAIR